MLIDSFQSTFDSFLSLFIWITPVLLGLALFSWVLWVFRTSMWLFSRDWISYGSFWDNQETIVEEPKSELEKAFEDRALIVQKTKEIDAIARPYKKSFFNLFN